MPTDDYQQVTDVEKEEIKLKCRRDKLIETAIEHIRPLDALKTRQFWHIYLMAFLSIFQGFYVLNVYKDFGQTKPALSNDAFLSRVGSISTLLNAIRFLWSGAMDLSILKGSPFKSVYSF